MSNELRGKRIVVTRAAEQAAPFAEALRNLGAEPLLMPAIKIAAPIDQGPFDEALRALEGFDWVVLTSVNAVSAVMARLHSLNLGTDGLSQRRLAVVGPATSEALAEGVRPPDLVPEEYVAEAVANAFPEVEGLRFLVPCADTARPELTDILRRRGAEVTDVVAYRTVPSKLSIDPETPCPDYITFTSGTTVQFTKDNLDNAGLGEWLETAKLVCIGPVTARALRDMGYQPAAVADEYTVAGMIQKLKELELSDACV